MWAGATASLASSWLNFESTPDGGYWTLFVGDSSFELSPREAAQVADMLQPHGVRVFGRRQEAAHG